MATKNNVRKWVDFILKNDEANLIVICQCQVVKKGQTGGRKRTLLRREVSGLGAAFVDFSSKAKSSLGRVAFNEVKVVGGTLREFFIILDQMLVIAIVAFGSDSQPIPIRVSIL